MTRRDWWFLLLFVIALTVAGICANMIGMWLAEWWHG